MGERPNEIEGTCLCGRPVYRDPKIMHICDPAREYPEGVRCARCDRNISDPEEPKMRLPWTTRDLGQYRDMEDHPVFGIVCAECWTNGGTLGETPHDHP